MVVSVRVGGWCASEKVHYFEKMDAQWDTEQPFVPSPRQCERGAVRIVNETLYFLAVRGFLKISNARSWIKHTFHTYQLRDLDKRATYSDTLLGV